ncbi:INO80 complex subunit C-like [Pomacea canaliculata]|uniref:INO80 complex subunit C-like n=1 Tax=Pomacea canaliculata TaxID=400727 RepID=UPI000D732437|nr:INO80 complex subunit C-like [Pomacea canaliculata]
MASTRKSSRVRTVSGFSPAKRKRPESPSFPLPAPVALSITVEKDVSAAVESVSNQETLTVPGGNTECIAEDTPVEKVSAAIFKDPNFVHSSIGQQDPKRTRVWKNLKQIVATERSLPWQCSDVTCKTYSC